MESSDLSSLFRVGGRLEVNRAELEATADEREAGFLGLLAVGGSSSLEVAVFPPPP